MIRARQAILTLFLIQIAALASFQQALADGQIIIASRETETSVSPGPPGARLINLPELEFSLRAVVKCKGDPSSVTISIADTVSTLGREALEDDRSSETTLTVPPTQLPLAASSRFCVAGDTATADEMLVPGLATAHASLRCQNGERESVHFANTQLNLRLKCVREPLEPQVESASSSDR
ncbi:MAG: hypothetical protein OEV34_14365 [Gammaproteobacteria bacterium]|jgi:hypothetical protein|nr:hypothetical protein [Gammaproteobacteria bacterium]